MHWVLRRSCCILASVPGLYQQVRPTAGQGEGSSRQAHILPQTRCVAFFGGYERAPLPGTATKQTATCVLSTFESHSGLGVAFLATGHTQTSALRSARGAGAGAGAWPFPCRKVPCSRPQREAGYRVSTCTARAPCNVLEQTTGTWPFLGTPLNGAPSMPTYCRHWDAEMIVAGTLSPFDRV